MARKLVTDPIPAVPTEIPADSLVITPNVAAAEAIGKTHFDLRSAAGDILKRRSLGIATRIRAAEALRQARENVSGRGGLHVPMHSLREIVGEMLRSGTDPNVLEAAASPRIRPIARVVQEYVRILANENLIDGESALSRAAVCDGLQPRKIFVWGYFRGRGRLARPDEFRFINALAGDESIFYLPCGEGALFEANREWLEFFQEQGWEVDDRPRADSYDEIERAALRFAAGASDATCDGSRITAVNYPDIEAEVRGTLARVKTAAAETPLDRIVVVCRDLDRYWRQLVSVASEYHLPLTVDHKFALTATMFGEFLTLLFDVVEMRDEAHADLSQTKNHQRGFLFEPTIRLMRHRFGPHLEAEKVEQARLTHPSGRERWAELTDSLECLRTQDKCSRAEWAAWLRDVLGSWKVREKTERDARELTAFEKFNEGLEELDRVSSGKMLTLGEFAADVLDVLSEVKLPARPHAGGVRVLEPNKVVGGEFDRVFVIGMAEGMLPVIGGDRALIDLFERRRLAREQVYFEDVQEIPRWEAQSFYFTLLACKGQAELSFPQYSGDGEMMESSYFRTLGLKPERPAVTYVSSVEEYRRAFLLAEPENTGDAVLASARRRLQVEMGRESAAPADEYDGVTGIPYRVDTWSATSLSKIGACPFKWFALKVLGLKELKEADHDLPGDLRGRLYHKTLELALDTGISGEKAREKALELLEEKLAIAIAEEASIVHIVNWELRRHELLDTLRYSVESDAFIGQGSVVMQKEVKFSVEVDGVTFTGVIDRIDKLENGELEPIDYKSSSYVSKVKDEAGFLKVDIQLPFYSQVALPHLFPDQAFKKGVYLNLGKAERTNEPDVNVRPAISSLIQLTKNGRFAVDPDVKLKACEYCEFDIVCRKGPRLTKKQAERNGAN